MSAQLTLDEFATGRKDPVMAARECACGCGRMTGFYRGKPNMYVHNHHTRKSPVDYVVDSLTGCWLWRGADNPDGYGCVHHSGRTRSAHVVQYEATHGPVPAGFELDHKCRNRRCVNPSHLEPVPHNENVRRGKLAKLTSQEVVEIREKIGAAPRLELATAFGVSRSAIDDIAQGRTWCPPGQGRSCGRRRAVA